jgi:tRNA1(Val) A37 N6-methylase TrmN6
VSPRPITGNRTFSVGETTSDTLVLAASAPDIPPGSLAFDLGTGCGEVIRIASLRNEGSCWVGIDCREEALMSFLGWADTPGAGSGFFPVCCLVEDVASAFPAGCADAVLANPPYGVTGRVRAAPDRHREMYRSGSDRLLHEFIRASAHLLRSHGRMVMVNRPGNLNRILTGLAAFDLGPDSIQPVGEKGRPATLVVIGALRSVRCDLKLLPQRSVAEVTGMSSGITGTT